MTDDRDPDDFDVSHTEVTLSFDNVKAANHFKAWLCESGEQSYCDWMVYRERGETGPITGIDFDYWCGGLVRVKCGRLTND